MVDFYLPAHRFGIDYVIWQVGLLRLFYRDKLKNELNQVILGKHDLY